MKKNTLCASTLSLFSEEIPGKVCVACEEWKPLTDYRECKPNKDGLNGKCRRCLYIYKKSREKWVKQNDPERYQRKLEHNRAYFNAYREEHLEYLQAESRKGRKRRYQQDPEKYRAEGLRWVNIRKARKEINGGSHTHEQWLEVCSRYGNRCLRCGLAKPLAKDHIIPIKLGGSNDIGNIQPLCRECNGWKEARFVIDFRLNYPDKVNTQETLAL